MTYQALLSLHLAHAKAPLAWSLGKAARVVGSSHHAVGTM